MTIGYVIRGNFNAAYFFSAEQIGPLCPQCRTCLDYSFCPNSIEIHPSKKYAVSTTYDGRLLYSIDFVEFCRDVLKSDQEFKRINGSTMELFYMFPPSVVEFDAERRKTRFGDVCSSCGKHKWIVGAIPAYLKTLAPLGAGFYRTNLTFGDGIEAFPLIMVGPEWKTILATKKFRGLEFREIVA